MIEKVNPSHPDKIADRIAGAIVDLAYTKDENVKIAVEVLIGHGTCTIIAESSEKINDDEVEEIVQRIAGEVFVFFNCVPQDVYLAANQNEGLKCGDNGIFKGVPLSIEEKELALIARQIYKITKSDGKYILDDDKLIICQSNIDTPAAYMVYDKLFNNFGKNVIVNPLGNWMGGINVDTGATNRKLGSDMGRSVTGGGLHGKDLSKADVSVNIYAFLKAQKTGQLVELSCAIGDTEIDGKSYTEIVNIAKEYIQSIGGFEKFAEWGLI